MTSPPNWTRRQFLVRSATLAALARPRWTHLLAQTSNLANAAIQPLLEGHTARSLRYTPNNRAFRIHNGRELFNRSLYAPSTGVGSAFRVDAGDLPEFSLFLPGTSGNLGHAGNLRLGISRPTGTKWLIETEDITARYTAGQMLYTLRDPLLGKGSLDLHLLPSANGGLHLTLDPHATPPDLVLLWAFGGVSGRHGRANGDLGLELEPVSRFFELRPTDCTRNSYILHAASADLKSEHAGLHLAFPPGARLHLADAALWNNPRQALDHPSPDSPHPILVGSLPLDPASPTLHLLIELPGTGSAEDPALTFATRLQQLEALSGTLRLTTPDPFLDAAASALPHAADALWDPAHLCLLEGAVSSRNLSPGWRGPSALTALGQHNRMRDHLRLWIARQNQTPLPASQDPDAPVTGPPDPDSHLTRKTSLLHTSGDLASSSRDRNLAFFDALIRHLRWTGDTRFAREAWPALTRHMDWQYRTFRRAFPNPSGPGNLPLYESYASIPSEDLLAGNGAGSTHATAANYFLNRSAATLARVLDEDPAPFEEEAGLLHTALVTLLWMPETGAFAEARDTLLPQTAHTSPALWTSARVLDADLPNPRQAWQIVTERLSTLRPIPVHGPGVPPDSGFLLPSTDWLPAASPTNQLSLAENAHFALALWQAGLPDPAFALLKGNLVDSMFRGLCPGNLHATATLDPFLGETARDLADPLGITARALVEGLFGILPDLLRATLTIRPGFPSAWNEAQLHHPDIDLAWRRDGLSETLEITSRLPQPVALTLILPARTTADPVVLSNGLAFPFAFDPDATGAPRLLLTNFPSATAWKIDIRWHGHPPPAPPPPATCHIGEPVPLPPGFTTAQIDDPQACLSNGLAAAPGPHAVFAPIHQGSCRFWLPIALNILPPLTFSVTLSTPTAETFDPIDLTPVLDTHLTQILARDYTSPRSPFCSLALPDHLLGTWSAPAPIFPVDDTGLRSAKGTLVAAGIPFQTPANPAQPNCRLLSFWQPDQQRLRLSLSGQARTLSLLMTGTTFPQATHTLHGTITVLYTDGSTSILPLRSPETWWPIDRDLAFDDYLARASAPLPPRIDLRSGKTRLLDLATIKGQPAPLIPGGAATLLQLPLYPDRTLASLQIECTLYGVVLALLSATLTR